MAEVVLHPTPAAEAVGSGRGELDGAHIGLTAIGVLIGLIFVGPFAYVLWRNFELGGDFFAVLFSESTLSPLRRSVGLGIAVSASAAAIGTALAWLTVRTNVYGRRLWRLLAPLPLVFPSFVGATALRSGFSKGGLVEELAGAIGVSSVPAMQGFTGAWLVLTLFTYPYVYLPVAARLSTVPPSLEDSARILGRSRWATFWAVVRPQISGSVWAGVLLVFLYTISDFGAVALLGYDTLTEQIYADALYDQPRAMTLSLILGLTALLVVVGERIVQRRRIRVETIGSLPNPLLDLGKLRLLLSIAVAAFIANALIGPLAVLGLWAWRGLTADVQSIGLSVDFTDLLGPMVRTGFAGLLTAAVAMIVVLPIAWLTARRRSRVGEAASAMVVAGFALPGVVIALAVVFWVLDTPGVNRLYQTLPMLIFAYVLHFGAQATRSAHVAVTTVGEQVGDAARTLGAGRSRRIAQIELPLMMPGLIAGAGLVLLSTMKELPATLLLAPTGFDTLATEIWSATEVGSWAQAGLASLLLVAVSAVLTWVVVLRRLDNY